MDTDFKSWIDSLDEYNSLAIYDIMLDIDRERQLRLDSIVIPIFPQMIRFSRLFPADSIGMRDTYMETRHKAIKALKARGIIVGYRIGRGAVYSHRWHSRVIIDVNERMFDETLEYIRERHRKTNIERGPKLNDAMEPYWNIMHPTIVAVARSRYESEHYADAVESALKVVSAAVKEIFESGGHRELDGTKLMQAAFSVNDPVIKMSDLTTTTGKDIQQGCMELFAGTIRAIRNPKAHPNVDIGPKRALHHLFLASLLMYKLDDRISPR